MSKLISISEKNLITPYKYILIQNNKGFRELCMVSKKKVKIGKKTIDIDFFENKKLNTFWEIGSEIREISSKEFFCEDLCKKKIIKFY
jgi:hypothetical protein